MTDLQIIESLCSVIEQQASLIRDLVTELKQARVLTDETAEQLHRLEMTYDEAIGDSRY